MYAFYMHHCVVVVVMLLSFDAVAVVPCFGVCRWPSYVRSCTVFRPGFPYKPSHWLSAFLLLIMKSSSDWILSKKKDLNGHKFFSVAIMLATLNIDVQRTEQHTQNVMFHRCGLVLCICVEIPIRSEYIPMKNNPHHPRSPPNRHVASTIPTPSPSTSMATCPSDPSTRRTCSLTRTTVVTCHAPPVPPCLHTTGAPPLCRPRIFSILPWPYKKVTDGSCVNSKKFIP